MSRHASNISQRLLTSAWFIVCSFTPWHHVQVVGQLSSNVFFWTACTVYIYNTVLEHFFFHLHTSFNKNIFKTKLTRAGQMSQNEEIFLKSVFLILYQITFKIMYDVLELGKKWPNYVCSNLPKSVIFHLF